ncbi:hypothetical protein CDAR_18821 [Caerostris darwini]|uniref:Uncharacterized protein n=1 Tax=Caerostris darwini TaxID=1538125 RepID=A0AAV4WC41_9ARAC|nr:hypothetical protein CDAR_18821 [Caerostris darwini]
MGYDAPSKEDQQKKKIKAPLFFSAVHRKEISSLLISGPLPACVSPGSSLYASSFFHFFSVLYDRLRCHGVMGWGRTAAAQSGGNSNLTGNLHSNYRGKLYGPLNGLKITWDAMRGRPTEKEKQSPSPLLLCGRLKEISSLLISGPLPACVDPGSSLYASSFFPCVLFCMIDCGATGFWGGLISAEAPISLPAHANFCS